MFTRFMDMHSGGGTKIKPYEYIYIEAPEAEAKIIFYNRFERNPERVTCTCCGEDYSYEDYANLEQATGFDRGCRYDDATKTYVEEPGVRFSFRPYVTLDEYLKRDDVLVIRADEIQPEERIGDVPEQGYVWRG